MLLLSVLDHSRLAITVVVRTRDVLGEAELEGRDQAIAKTNNDVVFSWLVVFFVLHCVFNDIMFIHDEVFTQLYRIGEPTYDGINKEWP